MATEAGPLFPFNDDMSALPGSLVAPRWRRWFLNLRNDVSNASVSISVPPQLGQMASLPITSMDGGNLSAGLFTIAWYLSIVTTEPASSAQVTMSWVDNAGAKSYTAPVVDGSVTDNTQPDVRLLIYSRAGQPISYSVTYVGASMVYDFRPVLQSVATS